ncbi:MAG: hypothetical protein LC798_11025 [Chloroflexi bacterium]|nr:hypothetical protein [Chloroflexota bacterium]
MSQINPGDVVRLLTEFFDADGEAADPTTVTLRIRPQGGTEEVWVYGTDNELIKDEVGNYHLDYPVPAIAPHRGLRFRFQWEGTGAVQVVEPGSFSVADPYRP